MRTGYVKEFEKVARRGRQGWRRPNAPCLSPVCLLVRQDENTGSHGTWTVISTRIRVETKSTVSSTESTPPQDYYMCSPDNQTVAPVNKRLQRAFLSSPTRTACSQQHTHRVAPLSIIESTGGKTRPWHDRGGQMRVPGQLSSSYARSRNIGPTTHGP